MVISGYKYKTPQEFQSSASGHGLNTPFPLLVGDQVDPNVDANDKVILSIFKDFYKGTVNDVRFPLIGIVDRQGNPVKVFNYKGESANFAKGASIIDSNKQLFDRICQ